MGSNLEPMNLHGLAPSTPRAARNFAAHTSKYTTDTSPRAAGEKLAQLGR